jgi:hypothetical protein
MAQDVIFEDAKLEIKDVKELSLDATYISLAENACTERPVYVFECRIIEILRRERVRTCRR